MIIATWNVNSIRARIGRVIPWLEATRPDVICLQELKVETEEVPRDAFAAAGYSTVAIGQKTYNGVAILSRTPASDVSIGMGDGIEDPQARLIAATVDGVRVISAYVPNGQTVGSDKFEYKLQWLDRLRRYLDTRCDRQQPLALCGDFNVAPEARDVYDPKGWAEETLFHVDARRALERVRTWGLVDLFRLHHQEAGVYSWWDYRQLGFAKGRGLRIDHVFANEVLARRSEACWIDREARKGKDPSDHAPVLARFTA